MVLVPGPEGTIGFTVGKKSDFVDFPMVEFVQRMNELEPGWGGGSTICGAPRGPGGLRSKLEPSLVNKVILDLIPWELPDCCAYCGAEFDYRSRQGFDCPMCGCN